MSKKKEGAIAKYQEIAASIARKLIEGEYQEGDKVLSRSNMASKYSVSPETVRRAICVLADIGVLEAVQGSGVTLLSIEKAREFLHYYDAHSEFVDLRQEFGECMERQRAELDNCDRIAKELMERAKSFSAANPIIPFRMEIPENCPRLGKSLGELNFWHYTGATVIAVERADQIILSPGPYAALRAGDVLYYVGNTDTVKRVTEMLEGV